MTCYGFAVVQGKKHSPDPKLSLRSQLRWKLLIHLHFSTSTIELALLLGCIKIIFMWMRADLFFIVAKSIHDGTSVETNPRHKAAVPGTCQDSGPRCTQMMSHFHTAASKAFSNTHFYWAKEFSWYAHTIWTNKNQTETFPELPHLQVTWQYLCIKSRISCYSQYFLYSNKNLYQEFIKLLFNFGTLSYDCTLLCLFW